MSINPDSLLIFRARANSGSKDAEKKKPADQKDKQATQSKSQNPKQLGKFQPDKNLEPMLIEEPKATTAPSRKQSQDQSMQSADSSKKQIRTSMFGDNTIKSRKEKIQEYYQKKSIYTDQTPIYRDTYSNKSTEDFDKPQQAPASRPKVEKSGRQKQSRDAAAGKTCVWHPWRQAFAICAYCHRPFCFQDTMESNLEYYCLEDIDRAPKYEPAPISSANNIGILSGILLLVSFLTFFYFSHNQILYIFSYINKVGLPLFISHVNYNYTFALVEGFISIISVVVAVSLFVRSKKGFYLGVLVCFFEVAVFSYQYLSTATLYLGIVDFMVFIAFIALLLSRNTYVRNEEKEISPLASLDRELMNFSNTGRF
jgi:hypothetical protein